MADLTSTVNSVTTNTPAWLAFCGAMAPISSIILYMAPIPTVRDISKRKKIGNVPLLPYTSMLSNSFIWFIYGIINSQPKLWTANGVGFILCLYYFVSFAHYSPEGATGLPGSVQQHVQGMMALATAALYYANVKKTKPIGNIGVITNLAMYASPLAAVKTVLASKTSDAIPLPLTVASLLSCILWTLTGYLDMKDAYVFAPCAAGIILGLMQVSLKLVYKESVKEDQRKTNLSPHLNSREVRLFKKK